MCCSTSIRVVFTRTARRILESARYLDTPHSSYRASRIARSLFYIFIVRPFIIVHARYYCKFKCSHSFMIFFKHLEIGVACAETLTTKNNVLNFFLNSFIIIIWTKNIYEKKKRKTWHFHTSIIMRWSKVFERHPV